MSAESDTEQPQTPRARGPRRGRWWRGFTGSLAAGLVALAVIVLGAKVFSLLLGAPGPGAVFLIAHPLVALLAVAAQRVADRRHGRTAAIAGLIVLADTALALWIFWWA